MPIFYSQTTELEKIASTKSNAYNLQPMDLSTKLLYETVSFLGQESCAGIWKTVTVLHLYICINILYMYQCIFPKQHSSLFYGK